MALKSFKIIYLLLFTLSAPLVAQNVVVWSPDKIRNYNPYGIWERVISKDKLYDHVWDLSHEVMRGRAIGTRQGHMTAGMIQDNFRKYGLIPYNETFTQSFKDNSIVGRNVIGLIPSLKPTNKYIVISAHFDHIGALNGFVYPGADNNSSGVAALLNLAELFSRMNKAGNGPDVNLIFAAFDGKEASMAGSRYFVNTRRMPKEDILLNINLDQIGSTLEPPAKDTSYLIVLGKHSLPQSKRDLLDYVNLQYNIGLDIHYDFYGSDSFTELIYLISDQASFASENIPALLFTSGMHKHTNKISDRPNTLSFEVLRRRTLLVFYLVMNYQRVS